jgi:hypothetical protein
MSKSISNVKLQSKSLGKETFVQYAEQLSENPKVTQFECFNPYTQESKKITITNWMTNILYPSLSRSLPVRMRRLIDMCFDIFYRFKNSDYFRREHYFMLQLLEKSHIEYDFHDYFSRETDLEKGNFQVAKYRYNKIKTQLYRYFDEVNMSKVYEDVNKHNEHHIVVVTNLPEDELSYLNKIKQNAVLMKEKEIDNQ